MQCASHLLCLAYKMLWILSCPSRRKIFPLCCNHLPSHKTGVSKGEAGCKFTSAWTFCSRKLKKDSLRATSHCGGPAATAALRLSSVLWSGHHTILLLLSSLLAPRDAREANTQDRGSWQRAGTPQPASSLSPAALQVSSCKKGPGTFLLQPQGKDNLQKGTGVTGLLCASGTHPNFALSRSNSQKLAGF